MTNDIPGFGGLFYDATGTLNVYLKNPSTLGEVRSKIAGFLGREMQRSPAGAARVARIVADAAGATALRADYDFRELLTWYCSEITTKIGGLAGVTTTDIDERRNRIVIGVTDSSHVEPIRAILATLPIPDGLVEVIERAAERPSMLVEEPRLSAASTCATSSLLMSCLSIKSTVSLAPFGALTSFLRPVPGGAGIERRFQSVNHICTHGTNLVRWIGESIESDRYFVTNSHCTQLRSVVDHGTQGQPTWDLGIGNEVADPGFLYHDPVTLRDCPPDKECRFSDAALIKYGTASNADHGRVAMPAVGGSLTISNYANITEVISPTVGWPVHKIGRATGRTTGTITYSCLNVNVTGTNVTLLCQARGSYSVQDGDSGSPVIEPTGDGYTAFAVGIHWGASGSFSPMYAVLNELNEAMPGGILDPTTSPPPPGPTVSIQGPSSVRPNVMCGWDAVGSGTGPFHYSWWKNWEWVSSNASVSTSFSSSGKLAINFRDGWGRTASAQKSITVSASAPNCGFF